MTGLADADGFKFFFQVCMWPALPTPDNVVAFKGKWHLNIQKTQVQGCEAWPQTHLDGKYKSINICETSHG